MKTHISVFLVLIFSFLGDASQARETKLVVRVKAIIKQNGSVIGETTLTVSEKASTFEGEVVISEQGVYELILWLRSA